MKLSYHDIKEAVYIWMTLLGAFFVILACIIFQSAHGLAAPVGFLLTAAVLFLAGLLCIFFGLVTFLIRDDPEVWS